MFFVFGCNFKLKFFNLLSNGKTVFKLLVVKDLLLEAESVVFNRKHPQYFKILKIYCFN